MTLEQQLKRFDIEAEKRSAYSVDVDGKIITSSKHVAIVRKDNDEIIYFPTKGYEIVQNKQVIDTFMEAITPLTNDIKLDETHSFVTSGRMSAHFIFPEFKIKDDQSDIDFSLYVDNSYDGTTGMRLTFGGIRSICTNGMVWGKAFDRVYAKHTQSITNSVNTIREKLDKIMNSFPEIEARIKLLSQEEFLLTEKTISDMEKNFGKKLTDMAIGDAYAHISKYDLLNIFTYYISHNIDVQKRQLYQQRVSKYFEL